MAAAESRGKEVGDVARTAGDAGRERERRRIKKKAAKEDRPERKEERKDETRDSSAPSPISGGGGRCGGGRTRKRKSSDFKKAVLKVDKSEKRPCLDGETSSDSVEIEGTVARADR
jgi:hypothetical protein